MNSESPGNATIRRILPWLLVLAGVAVYANGLTAPLLYDDDAAIVTNESIRRLWPPGPVLSPPPDTPVAGRPVVNLTLALNYATGGLDVRGYHAVNLLVHVLCGLLLFGIVRRTLSAGGLREPFAPHRDGLAFACALLFIVHPIQSECVTYVTPRTESIMALFYLLTLYCAIRADTIPGARWWTAAAIASCGLGMASKEAMVTAPLMVVLYDRVFTGEPLARLLRRRRVLYGGLASTWIVLAALMAGGPRSATVGFGHGVTAWSYAMNQCEVIVGYLRLAVWPSGQLLDYGLPRPLTPAEAAPWACILVALILATLILLARRPPVGFLLAWFGVILAPTSSVVPIASEVAAERRLYLPLAGLVVLVVVGGFVLLRTAARHLDHLDRRRAGAIFGGLGPAAVLVAALALAGLTRRRNDQYHRPVELWQAAADAVPRNHRALNNLGTALIAEGRNDEGIARIRQALEIAPGSRMVVENLSAAMVREKGLGIRH